MKNQFSSGIFSYFFLLLPSILSACCQTIEESVGTDSEDFFFLRTELMKRRSVQRVGDQRKVQKMTTKESLAQAC